MLEKQRTDDWFKKVEDWITKSIKGFVAAIFFLVGVGAIIGALAISSNHSWIIFLPFALGLLAYYSRDFAVVILALIVILVVAFPL